MKNIQAHMNHYVKAQHLPQHKLTGHDQLLTYQSVKGNVQLNGQVPLLHGGVDCSHAVAARSCSICVYHLTTGEPP